MVISRGGEFSATFQYNRKLVIYCNYGREPQDAIWTGNTSCRGYCQLKLTESGNLEILPDQGQAIWQTNTTGTNMRLVMQRDGNLVLYDGNNKKHWESGTSVNKDETSN